MNMVEQGILLNQEHIHNIENGINEPIPFAEKIKDLGYENLEAFFNAKKEYEMQDVLCGNVYSVEPRDAMPTLRSLLRDSIYGIVSVYTTELCVHHGQDNSKQLNINYCISNGIPIYTYDSFGGSIVATEGDYSIALLIPQNIDVDTSFILSNFKRILSKYLADVDIQGNDILVNGKKVAGTTSFGTDDYFFLIAHFSMREKNDLIRAICGSPNTDKIPGYIDSTALTTEQLMEEILSWLQGL